MMSPMECLSLFAFYRIFNYFILLFRRLIHTLILLLNCNVTTIYSFYCDICEDINFR